MSRVLDPGPLINLARAGGNPRFNVATACATRDKVINNGSDFIFGEIFWRAARCIPVAVYLGRTFPHFMKLYMGALFGSRFKAMTTTHSSSVNDKWMSRENKPGNLYSPFTYTNTKKEIDLAYYIITQTHGGGNCWKIHPWDRYDANEQLYATLDSSDRIKKIRNMYESTANDDETYQIAYMSICFELMGNGGSLRRGMTKEIWLYWLNYESLWLPSQAHRYWYGFWDYMEYMYHCGLAWFVHKIAPEIHGKADIDELFRRILHRTWKEQIYDIGNISTWTKERPIQIYLKDKEIYLKDEGTNKRQEFYDHYARIRDGSDRNILLKCMEDTNNGNNMMVKHVTDRHFLWERDAATPDSWTRTMRPRGRLHIHRTAMVNMTTNTENRCGLIIHDLDSEVFKGFIAESNQYGTGNNVTEQGYFESGPKGAERTKKKKGFKIISWMPGITLEQLHNCKSPQYLEWTDRAQKFTKLTNGQAANSSQHDLVWKNPSVNVILIRNIRRRSAHCCGRSARQSDTPAGCSETCYKQTVLEAAHTAIDAKAQVTLCMQWMISKFLDGGHSPLRDIYYRFHDVNGHEITLTRTDEDGDVCEITWGDILFTLMESMMQTWNANPNQFHLLGKMHWIIDLDDSARELCLFPGAFEHIFNFGYPQPEKMDYPSLEPNDESITMWANIIFFMLYGGQNSIEKYFTPHPRNKITSVIGRSLDTDQDGVWNWINTGNATMPNVIKALVYWLCRDNVEAGNFDVIRKDIGLTFIVAVNADIDPNKSKVAAKKLKKWLSLRKIGQVASTSGGRQGNIERPTPNDRWTQISNLIQANNKDAAINIAWRWIFSHAQHRIKPDDGGLYRENSDEFWNALDKRIELKLPASQNARDNVLNIIQNVDLAAFSTTVPVGTDNKKWYNIPKIVKRVQLMVDNYTNDAGNGWRTVHRDADDDANLEDLHLYPLEHETARDWFIEKITNASDPNDYGTVASNFVEKEVDIDSEKPGNIRTKANGENEIVLRKWLLDSDTNAPFRMWWWCVRRGSWDMARTEVKQQFTGLITVAGTGPGRYSLQPSTEHFNHSKMRQISTFLCPWWEAGYQVTLRSCQITNILSRGNLDGQHNGAAVDFKWNEKFRNVRDSPHFLIRDYLEKYPGGERAPNLYELTEAHKCFRTKHYLRMEVYIPPNETQGGWDPWRSNNYHRFFPSLRDIPLQDVSQAQPDGKQNGNDVLAAMTNELSVYSNNFRIAPPRGTEWIISALTNCGNRDATHSEAHRIVVSLDEVMIRNLPHAGDVMRNAAAPRQAPNIVTTRMEYPVAAIPLTLCPGTGGTFLMTTTRSDTHRRVPVDSSVSGGFCNFEIQNWSNPSDNKARNGNLKSYCQHKAITFFVQHRQGGEICPGPDVPGWWSPPPTAAQCEMDICVVLMLSPNENENRVGAILGNMGNFILERAYNRAAHNHLVAAASQYSHATNPLAFAWSKMYHTVPEIVVIDHEDDVDLLLKKLSLKF
jgi:hypothetical protein